MSGRCFRLEAKGFGHWCLQVEHQAVFASPGHNVQPRADEADQVFIALQVAHFVDGGQALVCKRLPAVAQARGTAQPDDGLQIAQAAG
ncbi:hypothetical protein D3C71_1996280 [compost metagenome]